MNSTYRSTLWLVAKPAPDWNGTAVVGDSPAFKELKLSDFKGIEYTPLTVHCVGWISYTYVC